LHNRAEVGFFATKLIQTGKPVSDPQGLTPIRGCRMAGAWPCGSGTGLPVCSGL